MMSKAKYYMMVATMMIPLGFLVYLQNDKVETIGIIMVILGIVAMASDLRSLSHAKENETNERNDSKS